MALLARWRRLLASPWQVLLTTAIFASTMVAVQGPETWAPGDEHAPAVPLYVLLEKRIGQQWVQQAVPVSPPFDREFARDLDPRLGVLEGQLVSRDGIFVWQAGYPEGCCQDITLWVSAGSTWLKFDYRVNERQIEPIRAEYFRRDRQMLIALSLGAGLGLMLLFAARRRAPPPVA